MKNLLKHTLIKLIVLEARLALYIHKPKIIAVTGSVGKTSTKDAIATVVSSTFNTRKSEKSQNSEIGVPITILGLKNAWTSYGGWTLNLIKGFFIAISPFSFPKLLVLEIGADHPRDIQNITKWLKPDVAVFTRMSEVPVHVANFSSPQGVFEEKSFLALSLKQNGSLILNSDDDLIMSLKDTQKNAKIVTFGIGSKSDVRLTKDSYVYENISDKPRPKGFEYNIKTPDGTITGRIVGALGKQHIFPILGAVATGTALNIPVSKIEKSLENHKTPLGRMKILFGVNNSTIIDDTYNSSPVALFEALNTLSELKSDGKKIAVLGDMRELGNFSDKEHEKAGKHSAQSADFLIFVGENVLSYVKGALEAGKNRNCIFTFKSSTEAGDKLRALLSTGDIALVKGSQGVRMEKAVIRALEKLEDAGGLLVRQEVEWQKR